MMAEGTLSVNDSPIMTVSSAVSARDTGPLLPLRFVCISADSERGVPNVDRAHSPGQLLPLFYQKLQLGMSLLGGSKTNCPKRCKLLCRSIFAAKPCNLLEFTLER